MTTEEGRTEILFNEINKLVKRNGLVKAIMHLRLINNGTKKVEKAINLYEFILQKILTAYGLSDEKFFTSNERNALSDAKMSYYIFMNKYIDFSHEMMGMQFGLSREAVTLVISKFKKMCNDKHIYKDFFQKHENIESGIVEFINQTQTT
jgi:hypothetical protein